MSRILRCAAVCVLLFGSTPAFAQTPAVPQTPGNRQAASGRLRVYLDCSNCFAQYLRDEIEWVDFVVVPEDADVHLLSSDNQTGGGGQEVVLRLVGRGRYLGDDHDLRVVTPPNETENARRNLVLQTVIAGLLSYVAQDGLPAGLEVSVEAGAQTQADQAPVDDPWNFWVFRLAGGGSIDAEETSREVQWNFDATGDRVTEDWKMSFGIDVSQQNEQFNLDEDDPFEVSQIERSVDWFVAKSLGPHLSFGFGGRTESSTFDNIKFSSSAAPTIEFSVFPYSEYATRQFRIQYEVGVERAQYQEVTVFDKLKETLVQHEATVTIEQRQPWGTLELGTTWSQYFHDASLYRLEVDGEVSLRISRGLSLQIEGSASRIRDQISLPRRGATQEEVLLRLRELRSGYELSFEVGLSYTFGSLFNNIVNPRF